MGCCIPLFVPLVAYVTWGCLTICLTVAMRGRYDVFGILFLEIPATDHVHHNWVNGYEL